jgi:hypothetical protein
MRFHANSVSASEKGDYYQIWFEAKDSAKEATDPHEADGPYVIVQRDFKMPDDGRCSAALNPHIRNYTAAPQFSPTRLSSRRYCRILSKT